MKGQTLVETLIALGIAIVVITALTTVMLTGLNNTQYSKLQNQATQYAQQGMELMRSYRDATPFTSNKNYCLPANCNPVTNPSCITTYNPNTCTPIEGMFTRRVLIQIGVPNCGAGNFLVTVNVLWSDGKCASATPLCHKVSILSCMVATLQPTL